MGYTQEYFLFCNPFAWTRDKRVIIRGTDIYHKILLLFHYF